MGVLVACPIGVGGAAGEESAPGDGVGVATASGLSISRTQARESSRSNDKTSAALGASMGLIPLQLACIVVNANALSVTEVLRGYG